MESKEALRKVNSSFRCQICVIQDVTHVMTPCGHTLCFDCLNQMQRNRQVWLNWFERLATLQLLTSNVAPTNNNRFCFCSVLFLLNCVVLFRSLLCCSALFCIALLCSLLYCSALFCCALLVIVLLYTVLFCSVCLLDGKGVRSAALRFSRGSSSSHRALSPTRTTAARYHSINQIARSICVVVLF